MNYNFTGKNIQVSDAVKERAASKLSKLERLIHQDANINVAFSIVKQEQKVEVTIPLQKRILRAEVVSTDLYSAIDQVVDILEKQLNKYKGQLRHRGKKDKKSRDEFLSVFNSDSSSDENAITIEKVKKFALKPMDAEEAAMEMDLLGHSFYVFKNSNSEEVNVVYKRVDGSYGLIEPEF